MSDIAPGTPEYQEAYDKEMARLDAEAGKKPAETTSETKAEAKAETTVEKADDKPDPVAELNARLERTEKALNDTKRWAHQNASEVSRLKREAEERKRNETRPAILDANPGLEDAIKHVAPPQAQEQPDKAAWARSVATAIPDIETLLGDTDFQRLAQQRAQATGPDFDADPLIAIRELQDLKTTHLRDKAIASAVAAAKTDFEKKAGKRSAMEVPGGSGGRGQSQVVDEAERIRTMSAADFNKMRSKALGY